MLPLRLRPAAAIRCEALIGWLRRTWASRPGWRVVAYDLKFVIDAERSRRAAESLRVVERVVLALDK